MKKLLSLLGAVLITASSSSAVVSCSYGTNLSKNIDKQVNYYTQISAEALRAGILADQNFNIQGNSNQGIDIDFATNYYSSKLAKNVFGDLFKQNKIGKPTDDSEVAELYQSVFGFGQGGSSYTIKDSFATLKANGGILENTNLSNLVNGQAVNNLKSPDSNISGLTNLLSGALSVVFSNDFNPTLGGTLIGLLTAKPVQDAIKGMKDTFNTISNIVESNAVGIQQILNAFVQNTDNYHNIFNYDNPKSPIDIANATNDQMLSNATNEIIKGALFFASGQKFSYKADLTNYQTPTSVLFNSLFDNGNYSSNKNLVSVNEKDKQEVMLEAISSFVYGGNVLVHYFSQFDKLKSSQYKTPTNGNHLFDYKKTNGEVISDILAKKYLDIDDLNNSLWYQSDSNKNSYTSKLNIQNLASDLQFYLSPTAQDPNGYNTLKLFTILLGCPKTGTGELIANPIIKTVVNDSLMPILETKLGSVLTSIPVVGSMLKPHDLILSIQNLLISTIDWITTNGDDSASRGIGGTLDSVVSTLGVLIPIVQGVVNALGSKVPAIVPKILNILNIVSKYLSNAKSSQLMTHPWTYIYSQTFLQDIAKLLSNNELASVEVIDLLNKLKNIKTALTTNVGTISNALKFKLPDWLYAAKDLSISKLTDWLATEINTNRYVSLKDNENYALNTSDIAGIVNAIFPNSASTTNTDDGIYQVVNGQYKPVSIIEPLWFALTYYGQKIGSQVSVDQTDPATGQTKKTNIDVPTYIINRPNNEKVTIISPSSTDGKTGGINNNVFELILGLDKNNNTFIPNTVFYDVSRLYGHNYPKDVIHPEFKKAAVQIFTLFSAFAQFTNKSINDLVKEQYDKYFDDKNFVVTNVASKNMKSKDMYSNEEQEITYDINYFNPDQQQNYVYHIKMLRDSNSWNWQNDSSVTGWRVVEMKRDK